jgi:hypothetical protein
MSRKKIKVKYETFYRLSPAACEALGIDYNETRAASMRDLLQANKIMNERATTCNPKTEEEEDQ